MQGGVVGVSAQLRTLSQMPMVTWKFLLSQVITMVGALLVLSGCGDSKSGRNETVDASLKQLVGEAASGIPSSDAVRKIAASNSPDKVRLLILIVNAPYTEFGTRDAAVNELARIGSPDALEGVAELLTPHQGAAMRLRATELLKNSSCSDHCLKAVLFYVYRVSVGEETLRDQVSNEHVRQTIEEDQQQVASGIDTVLLQHRGDVLRILATSYGLGTAEPSKFSLETVERLHLIEACDLLLKSEEYQQKMNRFFKTTPGVTRKTIDALSCRPGGRVEPTG